MAGHTQEPVTFEDIAVYLSRTEWDAITAGQRELYCSIMLDNYKLLTSLGYPGPKPDILYRLERGEEPWVCALQGPARWGGPHSPSPGHDGDMRWLEEHPSSWWPGADRCRVLEEGIQTPCQAGGRCLQWRLQSRRLLRKFTCLRGASESPSEVADGEVESFECPEQALTVSWPGEEEEAVDGQGIMANITPSSEFLLHPVMEEQNKKADPSEGVQRSPPESQYTLGEGREELETIFKDHCYCVMSKEQLVSWALWPRGLREHNYCRTCQASVLALGDHGYCQVPHTGYRRKEKKILSLTAKRQAAIRRLSKQESQIRRIIRKAKRIMRRYMPYSNKRVMFAQGSFSTICVSKAPVPPAGAEDDPTKGTCGEVCPPATQEAVLLQSEVEVCFQEGTSEAVCAPLVSTEPLSLSSVEVEVKTEPTCPKACTHCESRGVRQSWSPSTEQSEEGDELGNRNPVLLEDMYKMVLRTVDQMLDSICNNFEHSGFSPCKDTIVIWINGSPSGGWRQQPGAVKVDSPDLLPCSKTQ